jgi:NAD-dependent deacetylase
VAPGIPVRLVTALHASRHTVILTGSGVSAESGIPTFRDRQTGLWAHYRPEDLATRAAFERDPALVWQWYQWRREMLATARPNPAHTAIAALERLLPKLTLITQNVDGLHQRAGSSAVIEFHGNIHRNRCSVENCRVEIDVRGTDKPPRCPNCNARIRPDVVWFGEPIPSGALCAATLAVSDCDLFIAAGTSAMVQPAAGLADLARESGALLVEVNTGHTVLSAIADIRLEGSAAESLSAIVKSLGRAD